MEEKLSKYGLIFYKFKNGLIAYHREKEYDTYIIFNGENYTSCDGVKFITFDEAYKHTYG